MCPINDDRLTPTHASLANLNLNFLSGFLRWEWKTWQKYFLVLKENKLILLQLDHSSLQIDSTKLLYRILVNNIMRSYQRTLLKSFIYFRQSMNSLSLFIQYIWRRKKINLRDWARTREKDIGNHPRNRNNSLLFYQISGINFCYLTKRFYSNK